MRYICTHFFGVPKKYLEYQPLCLLSNQFCFFFFGLLSNADAKKGYQIDKDDPSEPGKLFLKIK